MLFVLGLICTNNFFIHDVIEIAAAMWQPPNSVNGKTRRINPTQDSVVDS